MQATLSGLNVMRSFNVEDGVMYSSRYQDRRRIVAKETPLRKAGTRKALS